MAERRVDKGVIAALAGWAALHLLGSNFGPGTLMGNQTLLARALSEAVAGCVMLLLALRRGSRLPSGRGWLALLLLGFLGLAETLLRRPYIDSVLHVTYLRVGVQGLVLLAMPLWLALLGALEWVPDEVPRRTVIAALSAIGAYCLLLRAEEMSLRLYEVPALLLTVLYALGLAWAWSFARGALEAVPVLPVAGWGLLLSAAIEGVAALLIPEPYVREFGLSGVWPSLALAMPAAAGGAVLWFWLLRRMELSEFSAQTVAALVAVLFVQFVWFGLLSWRVDLALTLSVGAMWTALRGGPDDEGPVRLGLAGEG